MGEQLLFGRKEGLGRVRCSTSPTLRQQEGSDIRETT
jgi:hypothetical protein